MISRVLKCFKTSPHSHTELKAFLMSSGVAIVEVFWLTLR